MFAAAKAFAAAGTNLTLLDINADALARARKELKIAYANIGVEAACGSTTDESAVKHSFAQAEVRFGNLDFSK